MLELVVHPRQQVCVLALGSTNSFPMRALSSNLSEALKPFVHAQEDIKKAQTIIMVGGGPVSIEYAGVSLGVASTSLLFLSRSTRSDSIDLGRFLPRNPLSLPYQRHHHRSVSRPPSPRGSVSQTREQAAERTRGKGSQSRSWRSSRREGRERWKGKG